MKKINTALIALDIDATEEPVACGIVNLFFFVGQKKVQLRMLLVRFLWLKITIQNILAIIDR